MDKTLIGMAVVGTIFFFASYIFLGYSDRKKGQNPA